jgi:hypothetical protein
MPICEKFCACERDIFRLFNSSYRSVWRVLARLFESPERDTFVCKSCSDRTRDSDAMIVLIFECHRAELLKSARRGSDAARGSVDRRTAQLFFWAAG